MSVRDNYFLDADVYGSRVYIHYNKFIISEEPRTGTIVVIKGNTTSVAQ